MAKFNSTYKPYDTTTYEYVDPMVTPYPTPTYGGTGATPVGLGGLGALTFPSMYEHNSRVEVGKLVQDGYWVKATGSRVTKSGWTDKSDWDYVVYDPDRTLETKLCSDSDWVQGGSGNGEEFNSFKKGDINFILVDKEEVWKHYIIATNLIKSLDCKTKKERVAIFDSVFGRDKNTKAVEF